MVCSRKEQRTFLDGMGSSVRNPKQTFVLSRRFIRTDAQKLFTSYSPSCELPRRPILDLGRVTRLRVAAFRSLRKVGHSR
jgi:hypothetical protein